MTKWRIARYEALQLAGNGISAKSVSNLLFGDESKALYIQVCRTQSMNCTAWKWCTAHMQLYK